MNRRFRLNYLQYLTVLITLLCGAFTAHAGEERLPLWEFGIGGGAFTLPQYMGSDERYTYPFAFPYLIYRGERWRLDRSGLRNRLFDNDRLSLDASLSGGLPVKNSNKARQGMPSIYLTGEIGPRINLKISESERISWSAHLASRAAVNIRGKYVGWVTEPYLRYSFRIPVQEGVLRFKADLGALYGSAQYNDTYYGVAPAYVTATRPAYQARSGIHSIYFKARLRYPLSEDLELFTSAQARTLSVGVIKDSPLVKSRSYLTAALGLVWIYTRSDETVLYDETGHSY